MTREKKHAIAMIGLGLVLVVLLVFVKADSDTKDAYLCHAVAEDPDMDMTECPVHQSKSSWLLTIAFGISFLILGVGIHMLVASAPEAKNHPVVDVSRLSLDEQKIVELLASHDGSMYQSDIVKATGYSKVQMTRVLDKLEHNGIIDRKRRGMTNIVVLQ